MGKGNGIITAAAIVAAIVILPDLLSKKEGESNPLLLGGFGQGETPSGGFDLGSIFGGIGDMFSGLLGGQGQGGFDFNSFLAGLGIGGGGGGGGANSLLPGDMWAAIQNWLSGGGGGGGGGTTPDFFTQFTEWFKNNFGVGGGGGGGDGGGGGGGGTNPPGWFTPIVPTGNIFTDLSNSLMGIAKAGVTGVGIYGAAKILPPLIKTTVPYIEGLVSPLAKGAAGLARGGVSMAGRGLTAFGGYLTTPLSELGLAGWAGAVPLVAAAGFGGWELGTLFNKTPPGQWLQKQSGNLGGWIARGNNPVQSWLFPHANVNVGAVNLSAFQNRWGISLSQAQAMNTAQLQALIAARVNQGGARVSTVINLPSPGWGKPLYVTGTAAQKTQQIMAQYPQFKWSK